MFLRVAYLGGSITNGAGASNPEVTSWRAITTAWLKNKFGSIQTINAAIGGTGSDLAAFRLTHDILPFCPTLVFVEFAVNDAHTETDRIERAMEGVVRRLWTADAATQIVFVYTTTVELAHKQFEQQMCKSIAAHQRIADYYGIPAVNGGKALWEYVQSGRSTWQQVLPDGVHPADSGHAVYAHAVCAFLERFLIPSASLHNLPVPLQTEPYDRGTLLEVKDAVDQHWRDEALTLTPLRTYYVSSNIPGAALRCTFQGTVIGLYWVVAPDAGAVNWSVDGSPHQVVSAWDKYAENGARIHYTILSETLSPGTHEFELIISAHKHERSSGHWIRIAALLVNDGNSDV
jgi:acyl-CoA thioesterase I